MFRLPGDTWTTALPASVSDMWGRAGHRSGEGSASHRRGWPHIGSNSFGPHRPQELDRFLRQRSLRTGADCRQVGQGVDCHSTLLHLPPAQRVRSPPPPPTSHSLPPAASGQQLAVSKHQGEHKPPTRMDGQCCELSDPEKCLLEHLHCPFRLDPFVARGDRGRETDSVCRVRWNGGAGE